MATVHAEVTADHQRIALVAAGADVHEVAAAAKRLQLLTPLFSKSDPPGALTVPLTWPAIVQLGATFGDQWRPGPGLQAWIAAEVQRRTVMEPLLYTPPVGLALRPYQVSGAQLIAATGRALISDDPRTGKTPTTVVGLVEWASRRGQTGPVVVVCPASVIDPWVETWEDWAPHVRTVAWRGPKRRELLGTADVYVTSYETARIDAPVAGTKAMRPLTQGLNPVAVVLDEHHMVKNPKAKRTQAVSRICRVARKQGGAVVALSGTPVTKHTGDLYTALACLEEDAWPSGERWNARYLEQVQGDYDVEVLGLNKHTEPEFRLCLLGQHRRVARADVMGHLPPKIHSVRTVELPEVWRKVYNDFEEQMLAELPDGSELEVMSVLTKLNFLSGLASAAADVEVTYGPDLDKETGEPKKHTHLNLKAPSWKVDALLEILAEREGEKVVVFAPSHELIDLAGAAAAKAASKGELPGFERVGYVVGGQAAGNRTETIREFQTGSLNLICATTQAGGAGITLSKAGTLVFLQRPWSLVDSIQAEDRAEGDMEATRGTEIIDVLAANTVESRVRAALRGKGRQLAELLKDPRIVAELLGGTSVTTTKESA